MARHGYLDDDAFAASVARRRLRSGHGQARVAAELRARGVGERALEDALRHAAVEEDEAERAGTVADRLLRRHAGDDPRRAAMRTAAALERRGYAAELIARVLRERGVLMDGEG